MKFTTKTGTEKKKTQTCGLYIRYGDGELHHKVNDSEEICGDNKVENVQNQDMQGGDPRTLSEETDSTQPDTVTETVHRRTAPRPPLEIEGNQPTCRSLKLRMQWKLDT